MANIILYDYSQYYICLNFLRIYPVVGQEENGTVESG
jgi:hypothetical protein